MATVTLRIKDVAFDIDPLATPPQITRFAISYDLIAGGVTTPKFFQVAPDISHAFHLWRSIREALRPLLAAEGITPPPLPRPEPDARGPSPGPVGF